MEFLRLRDVLVLCSFRLIIKLIYAISLITDKRSKNMRKIYITGFILLVLSVVFSMAAEEIKFGDPIELKESLKIKNILENPGDYLGKLIRVEGTIVDVCAHMGCWMEIGGDEPFTKIRVKVNDGDMVFPLTAKGQHAVIEGELVALDLSQEQASMMKKAECEEKGEHFDPDSVTEGITVYQIKPRGVVIQDE